MSKKKEKNQPFIYEYTSKYCKVENGVVVGLDMDKVKRKQREIDALQNRFTTSDWGKNNANS